MPPMMDTPPKLEKKTFMESQTMTLSTSSAPKKGSITRPVALNSCFKSLPSI